MALTQDQINRRAAAETLYQQALKARDNKLALCQLEESTRLKVRQEALDCDARRNQYSIGWKKEQACSSNERASLYKGWTEAENRVTLCQTELAQANSLVAQRKVSLDAVINQIDLEIVQAKDALTTDPQYVLSKSRLDADIAEKEREQKNIRNERITKNVLIFLGVIVLVVGIVYLFRTNVIKLPS